MIPDDIEFQLQNLSRKLDIIETDLKKLLNIDEERLRDMAWVADYCNVHPKTIKRWIRVRQFPFLKPDGNKSQLKFRKWEVDQWIEKHMKV